MKKFFTPDDYTLIIDDVSASQAENLLQKFNRLHKYLEPRFKPAAISLYPYTPQGQARQVIQPSVTGAPLSLVYYRGRTQAEVVERLMGRDQIGEAFKIAPQRHPVIEVRLSPQHYVIELILSPQAWWDQRNLVGKLSVDRHRKSFFDLLQKLGEGYHIGFWPGGALGEMELSVTKFTHIKIFEEWMSTFSVGKDWFRIGRWYTPDEAHIDEEHIFEETMRQIRALYGLYSTILWTGDNNFHRFYQQPAP